MTLSKDEVLEISQKAAAEALNRISALAIHARQDLMALETRAQQLAAEGYPSDPVREAMILKTRIMLDMYEKALDAVEA